MNRFQILGFTAAGVGLSFVAAQFATTAYQFRTRIADLELVTDLLRAELAETRKAQA